MHLAGSAAICVRLIAVGTVITEASVVRAVLPADGSDARVTTLAIWVAEGAILLLVIRT